jgi:copper chaperone NosL
MNAPNQSATSTKALLGALLPILFVGAILAGTPAKPGPDDRCAVCGMAVAEYPNWLTVIEFKDGSRAFFDGPKDMFRFYFDISRYRPKGSAKDIAGLHVTDYYSTQLMKAHDAFFILGSDVRGPMGHELVPVRGKQEAEAFRRDHHGTKVLTFEEVTAAVVAEVE